MSLSYNEVYQLARSAGLESSAAITATAIAFAESGGNASAIGDVSLENSTWGPSVGLWQIRSLKAQSGTGGTRDATKLTSAKFNAKAMASISGGGGNFGAWSTYKNGTYKAHMSLARAAAGKSTGGTLSASSLQSLFGGSGATSSSVTSSSATNAGISIPNPLDLLGKGAGAAAGAIADPIKHAVVTGLVYAGALGLGVGLVLVGAWRTTKAGS